MAITLTYLDDLSRVRIAGSSLAAGYVRVERSINQLLWETVRGASALEVSSGAIQVDDYDGWAPDVENFYRIVAAVQEQFDTPADDQVFGDAWEVPAHVRTLTAECWGAGGSLADPEGSTETNGAGGGAYAASDLEVTPGEVLLIRPGQAAYNGVDGMDGNSSAVIRGSTLLVDADGGSGVGPNSPTAGAGGSDTFPASLGDVTNAGGDGGDTGTTSGGGGGGSGTAAGNGSNGSAGSGSTGGTGGAGEGAGGAGGDDTEVGDPGAQPGGGAGGHGDGASGVVLGGHGRVVLSSWPTGTPESDSITPDLDGAVWLKSIRYPALNRIVDVRFRPEQLSFPGRLGLHAVKGRSAPVAVFDQRGSRQWALHLRVDTAAAARDLELMLMVGGELLVHVPAASTIPGGFVAVADLGRARSGAAAPYRWVLPCTVVPPPGPEVVGTTLTWQTVFALYGGWSPTIAANASWGPLLATVADPDEVVVL